MGKEVTSCALKTSSDQIFSVREYLNLPLTCLDLQEQVRADSLCGNQVTAHIATYTNTHTHT